MIHGVLVTVHGLISQQSRIHTKKVHTHTHTTHTHTHTHTTIISNLINSYYY